MKILPLAYLGSQEWWREVLSPDAVVDVGEHYVKQTCRNRTEIATTTGRMALTANVVKGASIHKKAVKDMRLDYSKRWQHQHAVALRSAYKSSPYYDYFADRLEPFFTKKYDFLYDFNRELVEVVRGIASITEPIRYSEHYIVASPTDEDLRNHPFLGPASLPNRPPLPTYWQVFSERTPFEENLSIVDYLFNEGKL